MKTLNGRQRIARIRAVIKEAPRDEWRTCHKAGVASYRWLQKVAAGDYPDLGILKIESLERHFDV